MWKLTQILTEGDQLPPGLNWMVFLLHKLIQNASIFIRQKDIVFRLGLFCFRLSKIHEVHHWDSHLLGQFNLMRMIWERSQMLSTIVSPGPGETERTAQKRHNVDEWKPGFYPCMDWTKVEQWWGEPRLINSMDVTQPNLWAKDWLVLDFFFLFIFTSSSVPYTQYKVKSKRDQAKEH